ncbi:histidine kinase dimerization/phospho-acceptor domain-containing protein [Patulibacter minatonensis]|uniref:histidine kinase dimerization/phospho-acceptor domain-containing protein n=1 Tax=Patulibacter minatonensis TaxID=298163 RepID=UPI0004793EC5|nr:histidine kinase dimerization/phospho-acceptor domain-containing protein [Patulibacter minatonensis]
MFAPFSSDPQNDPVRPVAAAPGLDASQPVDVARATADVVRKTAEVAADIAATTERLQELERLQALVVSTTAHELRSPLTVLRAHADMLMDGSDHLDDSERASLEAISRAVVRLQEVSDHLVAELRGTAGGAEEALRRWLQLEPGATRTRPRTA